MAEKLKKTEAAESVTPAAPETAEATYTVGEFAANAERLFGKRANADLVAAAFKLENKQTATLSEAKGIVEKFMNREVK